MAQVPKQTQFALDIPNGRTPSTIECTGYRERLDRIVLYGSQACGDAKPDSDYDVAVFLNGMNGAADRWAELDRLAALFTDPRSSAPSEPRP